MHFVLKINTFLPNRSRNKVDEFQKVTHAPGIKSAKSVQQLCVKNLHGQPSIWSSKGGNWISCIRLILASLGPPNTTDRYARHFEIPVGGCDRKSYRVSSSPPHLNRRAGVTHGDLGTKRHRRKTLMIKRLTKSEIRVRRKRLEENVSVLPPITRSNQCENRITFSVRGGF